MPVDADVFQLPVLELAQRGVRAASRSLRAIMPAIQRLTRRPNTQPRILPVAGVKGKVGMLMLMLNRHGQLLTV